MVRACAEIGVGAAVGVSLLQVIYRTAKPSFVELGRLAGTLVYKVASPRPPPRLRSLFSLSFCRSECLR